MENFRAFHACDVPLDADVVLVYGENGAGKSSILQAIELAYTGDIGDFRRFGDDYPRCFARLPNGGATRVSLRYGGEDGAEIVGDVELIDGHWVTKASQASATEQRYFREKAYLPQSRLSRLLQRQEGDLQGSSLAESISELLGLGYLRHLIDGLEIVGDIRRVRRDSPTIGDLYAEEQSLLRANNSLHERVKELEARVQEERRVLVDLAGSVEVTLPDESAVLGVWRDFAQHLSAPSLLQNTSLQLAELQRLTAAVEDARDVLERHPMAESVGESLDLQAVKLDYERLANEVRSIHEACRRFSENYPEAVSLDVKADLHEAHFRFLSAFSQLYAKWEQDVASVGRLEAEVQALQAAVHQLQGESQALGVAEDVVNETEAHATILRIAAEVVHGDVCPLCGTDVLSVHGEHLRDRLARELQAVGDRLNDLTSRRQTQLRVSRELGESSLRLDTALQLLSKRRVESAAPQAGMERLREILQVLKQAEPAARELAVSLARLAKEEERARSREDLLRNIAEATGVVAAAAVRLAFPESGAETNWVLKASEVLVAIEEEVERLQRHVSAVEILTLSVGRLVAVLTELERVQADLSQDQARLGRIRNAVRRIETSVQEARAIRDTAGHVQASLVTERVSLPLSHLWLDILGRITKEPLFRPALAPPEVRRGKLEMSVVGVAEGTRAFSHLEAVLSCGNLNAAALSLFLAMNLLEKPLVNTLILDDPVQSMDDVHVVQLSALFRSLAYEVGRQVVIAVHERSLFDYLTLELGPTCEGKTLIALEVKCPTGGNGREIDVRQFRWTEDQVSFGQAI